MRPFSWTRAECGEAPCRWSETRFQTRALSPRDREKQEAVMVPAVPWRLASDRTFRRVTAPSALQTSPARSRSSRGSFSHAFPTRPLFSGPTPGGEQGAKVGSALGAGGWKARPPAGPGRREERRRRFLRGPGSGPSGASGSRAERRGRRRLLLTQKVPRLRNTRPPPVQGQVTVRGLA